MPCMCKVKTCFHLTEIAWANFCCTIPRSMGVLGMEMKMEFDKAVTNPMLMGCIELMREENTPEHRDMFLQELAKARFISPAIMEPAPVEGEDGKLRPLPNTKVQFPTIATQDGKRFFMAFSDRMEYEKWVEKNGHKLPTFTLKLDEYADMLFRSEAMAGENAALGLVVNPLGANVIVPKPMVAGLTSMRIPGFNQRVQMNMANLEEN